MRKFHYLDTIISPNLTEKATSLSEFNKVVFKVNKRASKESIKRSIEKIFKVNVVKINTINIKGKTKFIRNKKAFKSGHKKAIVTLKKGQSIDLATGSDKDTYRLDASTGRPDWTIRIEIDETVVSAITLEKSQTKKIDLVLRPLNYENNLGEIGRASCRERV